MTVLYNKEQIKAGLLVYIEPLLDQLFGTDIVFSDGTESRVGTHGSLVVSHEGCWYSFEEEESGGDLLALIQWHKGYSFSQTLKWSADFLKGRVMPEGYAAAPIRKVKDPKATLQYAQQIWQQAIAIEGTLAELYLKNRGIGFVSEHARLKLRFVSSLRHVASGNSYPALIAKLHKPPCRFAGILRIYLSNDGTGKAEVTPNKMCLGASQGAAVWLSPITDTVIVCEGLEDALSILYACPDKTVCSAIGSSIKSVKFPEATQHVIIAADNDPPGERYANTLARRLLKEGRSVAICVPDNVKDFNDILRG